METDIKTISFLAVSFILLVYLIYTLIKPEKF